MLLNTLKVCATNLAKQQKFNSGPLIHTTSIMAKDGTHSNNNLKRWDSHEFMYSYKMPCVSQEEMQHFDSIYPILVKDLLDAVKHFNIPNITDKYAKLLDYNVPNSKKRRGLSCVLSYKLLEDPQKLTPENLQLAGILGWFLEMWTASLQINDDMLDNSSVRRNKPAWYKVKNVEMSAPVDAVVMENSVYVLLDKYFQKLPCYMHLVTLCHDVMWKTNVGQTMDYQCCYARTRTLDKTTIETYRALVKCKNGDVMYYFPVAAAMCLAGIQEDRLFQQAQLVLQEMGYWAQLKNDFLDCFGDVNTNRADLYGDIREGKCAWPAVAALGRATPEQRAIMQRCFGRADDESVQAVMDVYRAVNLPTVYASHQKEVYNNLLKLIDQTDSRIPKEVFYNTMDLM